MAKVQKIHEDGRVDFEFEDEELDSICRAAARAGMTPEAYFSAGLQAQFEAMGAPKGCHIEVLDLLDR